MHPELLTPQRTLVLDAGPAQLWATASLQDRRQHGPAATTTLTLRNTGTRVLRVQQVQVSWHLGADYTLWWPRHSCVPPGTAWTVLDDSTCGLLRGLAHQHGQPGFAMGETRHTVRVCLGAPWALMLAADVYWGFATPQWGLGFFIPALESRNCTGIRTEEQLLGYGEAGEKRSY